MCLKPLRGHRNGARNDMRSIARVAAGQAPIQTAERSFRGTAAGNASPCVLQAADKARSASSRVEDNRAHGPDHIQTDGGELAADASRASRRGDSGRWPDPQPHQTAQRKDTMTTATATTAAEATALELDALGVDHLFLMTGRDNTLWIALQKAGIRQVLART